MTEDEIKLLIHDKTEEIVDKRSNMLFWRNVFLTVLILPLAYYGVSKLAGSAAEDAASKALRNQEQAWAAIYSQITKDAVESATKAEAAKRSADNATSRAEGAAEKLELAAENISTTLGFEGREDVINAIMASADIQSVIVSASQITIGNCLPINGRCGHGTYKQPTFYLDRVEFYCPTNRPILKGISFKRCGPIGQRKEGLQLAAKCCALSLGDKQ